MNKLTIKLAMLSLLTGGCPDEGPTANHDAASPLAAPDAGADSGPGSDAASEASVPAASASLEQRSVAKLKECGLYEAEGDADQYSIQDGFDVCVANCTLSATCAQMKQLICEERENNFARCLIGCEDPPPDGFRCADGSRIAHAALCDLLEDCPDGEDEQRCGQFICHDGEVLPASSARCDWIEDCLDGSDELGCALSCP